MNQFVYHVPTKVLFGEGIISKLPETAASLGKKALLVYGGGSIKKNGLYDSILSLLGEIGMPVYELSGVEPNPRIDSVRAGVQLMREHDLDVIIAAGGGSSMDCAKAIAAAVHNENEAWDVVMNPGLIVPEQVPPIIAIPTLSATGSEMDEIGVISNMEIPLKKPLYHPCLRPAAAIMDPGYTYSVSKFQTGSGSADIFSHALEVYFNRNEGAYLTNRLCEAVMKTVLQYGKKAVDEPENYEARSNLMWASSIAINGLLKCGKETHLWMSCHAIEHVASAYYDIAHGAGLAVITPHWMRRILSDETVDKFAEYGVNVFGIDASLDKQEIAEKAIQATEDFFVSLGMPMNFRDLGVYEDTQFEAMARDVVETGGIGRGYVPLDQQDVLEIYKKCWK